MRAAIGYLVDRGLLVRKRGVGTQVVRAQVDRPLELTSLHDDLRRGGRAPTTTVLELDEVPAGAEPARGAAARDRHARHRGCAGCGWPTASRSR